MGKTRQISITLPEDLIDTIEAAVDRGEARSVSSYIASRLTRGVVMDAFFAEWDADRDSCGVVRSSGKQMNPQVPC